MTMRVHELAKQIDKPSKELIAEFKKIGVELKNHMAIIPDGALSRLPSATAQPGASASASAKKSAKASAAKPAAVAAEKKSTKKTASPKVTVKKEEPAVNVKASVPSAQPAKKTPGPVVQPAAKAAVPASVQKAPVAKPVEVKVAPAPVQKAPAPAPAPVSSASAPKAQPAPAASAPAPKAQPVQRAPEPPKPVYERPRIVEELPSKVTLSFPITVGNFAQATGRKVADVIKTLMKIGVMANVNQLLNEEIGMGLASALSVEIEKEVDEIEALLRDSSQSEDPTKLKLRPPVVTMMGHVDHGKTSLLDAIRKTSVASREKGFITQHIGAYGVDVKGKGHVTFLDTPGHEAFTAMRARGANVTDIVILVVAADDGIMPQTVEAISHAREAGCPIVVAINKIDLPNANLEKVRGGLQKADLVPEEWGGKTICVKVSAKTGAGIDELLELLLLQAEVLELKANPDRSAVGTIIEGHLSKGSGPVATLIVQNGTLRPGDVIVAGPFSGRVRALRDDLGKQMKQAGPSYAAEVMGLDGVPEAGEIFHVAPDEKTARRFTEKRKQF